MADKYTNFAVLDSAEPAGAYSVEVVDRCSPIAVAAPHGGGIEPGTSEIALAIAGNDLSCYRFEGKKAQGNWELHITSSNFDEPQGLALLSAARIVLTVHGEDSAGEVVYVGGRHTAAIASVRAVLEPNGFTVRQHLDQRLQGLDPRNICNIGSIGAGVQLEMSRGLRESFFRSLPRAGRMNLTPRLSEFSALVRQALLENGL